MMFKVINLLSWANTSFPCVWWQAFNVVDPVLSAAELTLSFLQLAPSPWRTQTKPKEWEWLRYPHITAVLVLHTDWLELLAADVGCKVVLDFPSKAGSRAKISQDKEDLRKSLCL